MDTMDNLSIELLRTLHLFITWGIFWGAVVGAYFAWKSPPRNIHQTYAVLGYLIITALIGPVAMARFFNEYPEFIPWLDNEALLLLVVGHLVALTWTWVLATMTVRRYRRERKK